MYMDIPILIGIMLVLLGIGFIAGSIVQKMIDDEKVYREQVRANEYRDTLERERREAASARREANRRHEEERKVIVIELEDVKQALREEQLRVDIYRRGGMR